MEHHSKIIFKQGLFLYNDPKLSQLLEKIRITAWCTKRNSKNEFEVYISNNQTKTQHIIFSSESDYVFLDRIFSIIAQAIDSCAICKPNHYQTIHEFVNQLTTQQKMMLKEYFSFIIPCEAVPQIEFSKHIRNRRDMDLEKETSFYQNQNDPIFKEFLLSLF